MNLRGHAAQILARVIGEGHSLTAALDDSLHKLPHPQDRAFLQALCYGVIRQYFRLDATLSQLLDKPLKRKDSDIKALLMIGLYQLQYMRVKDHAAVSETVAASKHKSWSKGLINGTLRNYQRDSERIQQAAEQSTEARLNHPEWLINVVQQDWPDDYLSILNANDQAAPMALRVNLGRISREEYLAELSAHAINAHASPLCKSAVLLENAVGVEQLPGFMDGLVSVQDTAAQLAASLLALEPQQRLLDLCAAPGGKTAAILEQQPDIQMLAIDIDEKRLQRVHDTLHRLKLSAETSVADASDPKAWSSEQLFDRILIDAPCSGLGVIRRHPDIKLLRRASDIENLKTLQAKILNNAWSLLAPNGILLYATCSVLKEENERQIEHFLKHHEDAREIPLPEYFGQARLHGRQILTGEQNMDGFYYAKLQKTA